MCKETLRNWVYFVFRYREIRTAILNYLMDTYREGENRFFVHVHLNSARGNECYNI